MFRNLKVLAIGKSKAWKRLRPNNPEDPSHKILKECIWDQYLSKNMKWAFGNMGSMSSRKHEIEIWYFPLKKSRQLHFLFSVNET